MPIPVRGWFSFAQEEGAERVADMTRETRLVARKMCARAAAACTLLLSLLSAGPARAQPTLSLPKVVEPCVKQADEIVVCGNPDELRRYRLPLQDEGFDPDGPVDSVSRERNRLLNHGASGIGSCSTVGPGGYTGCDFIRFKERVEQKADSSDDETGLFFHVGKQRLRPF
jgi:hypothetical protein